MRNAAFVDGWKYGQEPRWEQRWFSLVFHAGEIGHRLCNESTDARRLWRTGVRQARVRTLRRPIAKTTRPVRMMAKVESRTLATASVGLASSGEGMAERTMVAAVARNPMPARVTATGAPPGSG